MGKINELKPKKGAQVWDRQTASSCKLLRNTRFYSRLQKIQDKKCFNNHLLHEGKSIPDHSAERVFVLKENRVVRAPASLP